MRMSCDIFCSHLSDIARTYDSVRDCTDKMLSPSLHSATYNKKIYLAVWHVNKPGKSSQTLEQRYSIAASTHYHKRSFHKFRKSIEYLPLAYPSHLRISQTTKKCSSRSSVRDEIFDDRAPLDIEGDSSGNEPPQTTMEPHQAVAFTS
nr:hypothetical protein CFP56_21576 [Quercus suber]